MRNRLTRRVTGTVLDVAGKPIPSAAVSVKNEANGVTRQTPSGADGKFSVSGLPAGTYSIEVSAPSFATSHRSGLSSPPAPPRTSAWRSMSANSHKP